MTERIIFLEFKKKKRKRFSLMSNKPNQTKRRTDNLAKLRAFDEALIEFDIVPLVIDATHIGVVVPSWLSKSKFLILNFSVGYNLPDLAFDKSGVSATLTFGSTCYFCLIPWEAVSQIRNVRFA